MLMSRCDNHDGLNGSSESILVKNDSNLDTSTIQIDSRVLEAYDLEVQKPSERAKIISDKAFFKKLSYSFYSESTSNSKSYSTLPKHYEANFRSPQEQKKTLSYPTSEPLSKAIINSLKPSLQAESKISGSVDQQPGIKAFKIKTLQNFCVPARIGSPKNKPATPLNNSRQKIEPMKCADKKESPRKMSVKLESPSKQENKTNSSTLHLEKLLKGVETNKSPVSATKQTPKLQSIEKIGPQKASEASHNHADSSNGFQNASPLLQSKLTAPTSTKLVLLPAGRITETKKEDKAGQKSLRSSINAIVAKDTAAARLNQLTTSRAALKKNIS